MRQSKFKRAAVCAALFVVAVGGLVVLRLALPTMPIVTTAEAKMRLDPLSIVPASGGAPIAFTVEVAATPQEMAVGLMFRTKLADDQGMLFPHAKPADLTMWMRNTYIPLDMLFIRTDGVIHRIEVNAEPLSERIIQSDGPVIAVLELAGGATGRLGIKSGDKVLHPLFQTADRSK